MGRSYLDTIDITKIMSIVYKVTGSYNTGTHIIEYK